MTIENRQSEFGMECALTGLERRGYRPAVVHDVGAADGAWTRLAASVWPETKFVCFEPLEERDKALRQLARDLPGRVQPLRIGLGNEDAELKMGVADGLYASSFAYATGVAERSLPVRRLDALIAEGSVPAPSFIKLDVQGFELRVLEGARQALAKTDVILMECQFIAFCEDMQTLDVTISRMSELGYVPYEFVDFLRRPLDGAMGQCDLLFVRKGHPLVSDLRWA